MALWFLGGVVGADGAVFAGTYVMLTTATLIGINYASSFLGRSPLSFCGPRGACAARSNLRSTLTVYSCNLGRVLVSKGNGIVPVTSLCFVASVNLCKGASTNSVRSSFTGGVAPASNVGNNKSRGTVSHF